MTLGCRHLGREDIICGSLTRRRARTGVFRPGGSPQRRAIARCRPSPRRTAEGWKGSHCAASGLRRRAPQGVGAILCRRPADGRASPRWSSRNVLSGRSLVRIQQGAFVGPKSARCEQKCEQFAGFRPLLCLPSGSWEGVITLSTMPPLAGLALSDQQVLADRLI